MVLKYKQGNIHPQLIRHNHLLSTPSCNTIHLIHTNYIVQTFLPAFCRFGSEILQNKFNGQSTFFYRAQQKYIFTNPLVLFGNFATNLPDSQFIFCCNLSRQKPQVMFNLGRFEFLEKLKLQRISQTNFKIVENMQSMILNLQRGTQSTIHDCYR